MSGLHELLDTYRSATYQCIASPEFSSPCGSMLLGALTRGAATANVLFPRPEVPFDGRSFHVMYNSIKAITSPIWFHSYNSQHTCSLGTTVISMVDAVVLNVEGLSLRVEDEQTLRRPKQSTGHWDQGNDVWTVACSSFDGCKWEAWSTLYIVDPPWSLRLVSEWTPDETASLRLVFLIDSLVPRQCLFLDGKIATRELRLISK